MYRILLILLIISLHQQAYSQNQLLITDQTENKIALVDPQSNAIIWEWQPATDGIKQEHVTWFNAPSDAKAVYNHRYILMNASGGGVALIRITDKKVAFYAYAGGNTHSVEVLPDGNIVTASSTGNFLRIFHVDTLKQQENIYSKEIYLPDAHGVVWDKKRETLWAVGQNKIYSLKYNFNCTTPDLNFTDSIVLPDNGAHDLFPVYGKDSLFITTTNRVFTFSPETKMISAFTGRYTKNIKSITAGPPGLPTIVMVPKEKWWTNEVLDENGNSIFKQSGLKMYKARWFLPNPFSYPRNDNVKFCN